MSDLFGVFGDEDDDDEQSTDWRDLLVQARTNLHGVSVSAIASRASVSHATVTNVLRGVGTPSPPVLTRIVEAILPPGSPEARRILARYTRATTQQLKASMERTSKAEELDAVVVAIRDGLADIAAAIREGHKT